ncbi:hypothetical protein KRR26_21155 [Corallococcus sp. M34]|uniref:Hint domain-containing protein n=1 Tax=Citreicoccus inhibens TaxID=2849499 RepID=UPI001C2436FA|nr:Hint domain-containing protein [Citreicoccus inhibens]MBU8898130.1 hypothetical protein [Citreicoccus inhibens]
MPGRVLSWHSLSHPPVVLTEEAMRNALSPSLLILTLGGSLTAAAVEAPPQSDLPQALLMQSDPNDPGGGGGGGGGGTWVPYNYRCTYDQLNIDQGNGRQKWAKRWQQGNPYGLTQWGGLDMRFWDSAFSMEANNAALAGTWLYPVYVDPNNTYAPWPGPGAPGSATAGYSGAQIQNLAGTYKPVAVQMDALCEPGCYTPDQEVLLSTGPLPIGEALATGRRDLVTLTPDATFASLTFMDNPVEHYTLDQRISEQEIVTFHTGSGGVLRVTTEHPLVVPEGNLKKARELGVGDALVTQSGKSDAIVSVEKSLEWVRAHNVRPVTADPTSNILVAQGFLSGSQRFQSEYVNELNRLLLRANVPDSVLPARP